MKIYFYIILLILISCKNDVNKITETNAPFNLPKIENKIKYATGFQLKQHKGYKSLTINSPYPKAKKPIQYILIEDKSILAYTDFHDVKFINLPIKKIVVTSTTHIPMLELLHEENRLVGFPNTKYISSERTRSLIDKGSIKELGKEENINTELLLDIQPDLVVGFSMSSNNKMFTNIEKAGIPVLLNGDWLEKTPLGRAEWIKLFGALFNKEQEANHIFNNIEKSYNRAKKVAQSAKTKPKVLSGIMYKDIWNMPAGNSYGAQFLRDANVYYPWQESAGTGSLSLNFEAVLNKAKDADIWISPGFFNSYEQLKDANSHYTQFNAFKNKTIYNFINHKGKTGGILYYELAPMQPDIVLKDIIKVMHPELLDDYIPFYLKAINR